MLFLSSTTPQLLRLTSPQIFNFLKICKLSSHHTFPTDYAPLINQHKCSPCDPSTRSIQPATSKAIGAFIICNTKYDYSFESLVAIWWRVPVSSDCPTEMLLINEIWMPNSAPPHHRKGEKIQPTNQPAWSANWKILVQLNPPFHRVSMVGEVMTLPVLEWFDVSVTTRE